jgi:flagellar basal body L-ring protein FlgH
MPWHSFLARNISRNNIVKVGDISKSRVFFIGKMYLEGVQQKDFGRYLSIPSEIRSIV